MDHAAGRRHNLHQAVEAVIDRQVRIDQRLQHVGASRIGLGVGGIDRRPPLRVGAGHVESNPPGPLKVDSGGQAYRAVGEAVAVHHALGAEFALRKPGHFRSRPPLGVFEKLLDIGVEGLQSQSIDQCGQPAGPGAVGGHLGPKIAAGLVLGADLSQDQSKDILHQLSILHHFDRRDDDALLKNFLKGPDTGRSPAPDIHVVGQVGDIAKETVPVKKGRNEGNVVEMDSSLVGVVGDERVSRSQPVGAVGAHHARHAENQ